MADEYTQGYCDQEGHFYGYAPVMTLIPNLIPAKRHNGTGRVYFTGNAMTLKKGSVLETDAGFGGQERIIGGLEEDIGSGAAPTNAVSVGFMPEQPTLASVSEALQARIDARNAPAKTPDEVAADQAASIAANMAKKAGEDVKVDVAKEAEKTETAQKVVKAQAAAKAK